KLAASPLCFMVRFKKRNHTLACKSPALLTVVRITSQMSRLSLITTNQYLSYSSFRPHYLPCRKELEVAMK
ncbi:hypothetical protein, partial [Escherichia coli]|uniref:hypothetical protein n=1 Tax=Escherichia coli TaxID=562 RepID=UPI001BC84802